MRDSQKHYVVVGTFVLVLLGALIAWLSVLAGGTGSTDPYSIEFKNVMGLTEGVQVLYEGYPVGEVDSIAFMRRPEASVYRLDVVVREGWTIPEDSIAVITQAGFLSAMVVDIHEGASVHLLTPGNRIPSLDVPGILTTLSSVTSKLGAFADSSLTPLLENLTEGTGSFQTLAQDAPVILDNLKTFTAQLNRTTANLNVILNRTGGGVDTILIDMKAASGNISDLTADFRQTGKRLDVLLMSMNQLVSQNREAIDGSIADVHYTLEVIASRVQEISYNLEATTRNMSELTAEIRRNPGLIIRGREFSEDLETGR